MTPDILGAPGVGLEPHPEPTYHRSARTLENYTDPSIVVQGPPLPTFAKGCAPIMASHGGPQREEAPQPPLSPSRLPQAHHFQRPHSVPHHLRLNLRHLLSTCPSVFGDKQTHPRQLSQQDTLQETQPAGLSFSHAVETPAPCARRPSSLSLWGVRTHHRPRALGSLPPGNKHRSGQDRPCSQEDSPSAQRETPPHTGCILQATLSALYSEEKE